VKPSQGPSGLSVERNLNAKKSVPPFDPQKTLGLYVHLPFCASHAGTRFAVVTDKDNRQEQYVISSFANSNIGCVTESSVRFTLRYAKSIDGGEAALVQAIRADLFPS
jgi:hypothetical protein